MIMSPNIAEDIDLSGGNREIFGCFMKDFDNYQTITDYPYVGESLM